MPSRTGRRADRFGVDSWDDGFDYIQADRPDPSSPLGGPSDRYFPPEPPLSHAKPSRASRYDPVDPLPRPPVGRDAPSLSREPGPGLRPRDSAEMLRDYHTRVPPSRRRRSPSPPRAFKPQRDTAYTPRHRADRAPSPPRAGPGPGSVTSSAGRRYQRSPSPPVASRRRAGGDRHPPRSTFGRPPLDSYPPPSLDSHRDRAARRGGPPPLSRRDPSYSPSPPPTRRRYSFDAGAGAPDTRRGRDRDLSPPRPRRHHAAAVPMSRSPSPRRPGLKRSSTTTAAGAKPKSGTGGGRGGLSGRWGKVAVSALQAGGLAAYNMRDTPGAWAGPKGARVGIAALGAAAVDAFKAGGEKQKSARGGGDGGGGSGRKSKGIKNSAGEAFGSALGDFVIDGIARTGKRR